MELVKINTDNVWDIVHLKVTKEQDEKDFVASNECSVIEAFAAREEGFVALPFGLYEEGKPVGFLMIGYGECGDDEEPEVTKDNYCIWRLMIDENYQGKGYGKKAMEAALAYIKTWPCGKAKKCWLSYEPENEVGKALYAKMGFKENGEVSEGEVVAVLDL